MRFEPAVKRDVAPAGASASARAAVAGKAASSAPQISLRKFSPCIPRAVVIGASTGGPQALAALLGDLAPSLASVPVLVVLHMPADFTNLVTGNIARVTKLETRAAKHGEPALPGRIYFAPGEMHMRVLKIGDTPILCHTDGPPENFCKPAADVLFRSAAQTFGPAALGVVLTGMGSDGASGARAIVDAGGSVVAQDEASSVVWGMPGAVANAGLAAAVLPLERIGPAISGLLRGFPPGFVR
jgi:two-component system, chemotaxis family, protein-glutamate methylesterase/glutaminase